MNKIWILWSVCVCVCLTKYARYACVHNSKRKKGKPIERIKIMEYVGGTVPSSNLCDPSEVFYLDRIEMAAMVVVVLFFCRRMSTGRKQIDKLFRKLKLMVAHIVPDYVHLLCHVILSKIFLMQLLNVNFLHFSIRI